MEHIKVDILWRGGWNLLSEFSDANPNLDKQEFTRRFEKKYRCKLVKNINLDTYYIEFTAKNWTWFCLHYSIDQFEFI